VQRFVQTGSMSWNRFANTAANDGEWNGLNETHKTQRGEAATETE